MYALAVLLVVIGLALGGSSAGHDDEPASPLRAIEITCGADGARVTQSVGIARPDGVVVRFTHGPGEWVMTWEGAQGHATSAGSAHTAEMVWPIPPGGAKVQCHPADLGQDRDPSHEPRWWVGVRVRDPLGSYLSPSAGCGSWMGGAWHGDSYDARDEEAAAWDALEMLGLRRREDDFLTRSGYAEGRPSNWAMWRDGKPVAGVVMAARSDGRVQPAQMGGCADLFEGLLEDQRSTS